MSRTQRADSDLEDELRRLRALADATAVLGASRDFDESLRTMARLLVPAVADWCFVELLQPDGRIERRVIQAADPAKHELARRFNERFPLDPDAPVGSPAVIRSGEPELTREIPEAFLEAAAADAEHLEVLRGLGFRSGMVVPLRIGGEVVGDLALAQAESGRHFGDRDLAYVSDLAAHCSLLLEVQRREASERAAREELEAILEGIADAVVAQGPDGNFVFVNGAAVALAGLSSADELYANDVAEIGRRLDFRDAEGRPLQLADLPARRLLRGEDAPPLTVQAVGPDGTRRWARMQARPLRRPDGSVRLAITVIEDLTELTRAAQAQTFLAEASRVLAGSLDTAATLQQVAALAVQGIADWCVIDIATSHGFERVAVQHADPDRLAWAEELALRYPPARDAASGPPNVMRTGAAELFGEIPRELLEAGAVDAEHLRLIEQVGMRSAMVVPMTLRDSVLGAITLITAESGRRYDTEDLAVATDLATRAATAVETARLYEQRSAIANTLQASLLPPVLPEVEGVTCAAVFRAAGDAFEVGGDFYDLFSTSAHEWFAVIGDVCGKGSAAAATTALVRYTVRAAAVRRRSPSMILRWLNDAMLGQEHDVTRFCTLVVVRLDLDPAGGTLRATATSGGHPLPRVVRADGTIEAIGASGTLIGVTPDIHTSEHSTTLNAGDALVLFTDGLTEAGAPDRLWSPADVDAALRGAHAGAGASIGGLVDGLTAAALGPLTADPRDDIAVLGLRKT